MLKTAGVSPAVAEEFVGHNSTEMNPVYTHTEDEAMRHAAESLPDVRRIPISEQNEDSATGHWEFGTAYCMRRDNLRSAKKS